MSIDSPSKNSQTKN